MDVKKVFGEVNTPPELREVTLDTLPSSFWKTPKRVLEPCCGSGGYVEDIIDRFMTGLTKPKSKNARYKLIVETCLVWGDINPDNVELVTKKIDPKHQYKLQSYVGDALYKDFTPFDAVITNPPYQMPTSLRKGGWGNKTLWDRFVVKTLDEWLSVHRFPVNINSMEGKWVQ